VLWKVVIVLKGTIEVGKKGDSKTRGGIWLIDARNGIETSHRKLVEKRRGHTSFTWTNEETSYKMV